MRIAAGLAARERSVVGLEQGALPRFDRGLHLLSELLLDVRYVARGVQRLKLTATVLHDEESTGQVWGSANDTFCISRSLGHASPRPTKGRPSLPPVGIGLGDMQTQWAIDLNQTLCDMLGFAATNPQKATAATAAM